MVYIEFMDQERLSLLALHFTPGVGDFLLKQVVSYCGSAEQVFKTPKDKLLKIPGVGELRCTLSSLILFITCHQNDDSCDSFGAATALSSSSNATPTRYVHSFSIVWLPVSDKSISIDSQCDVDSTVSTIRSRIVGSFLNI